ncbi:MAG: sugar transferase [Tetrasphaera sp.]
MAEGLSARQRAVKRGLDLVIAVPGLIVASPVILVAILVATVDTREFGLFAQARIGRDGVPFTTYKIRTMRSSRDLTTTVTHANDTRITRSGKVMRRAKLDELPQLINVVRGDMSLVGPRPDVPGFADQLVGEDRVILTLRPGITGPATLAFRDEEALLAAAADAERYNRDIIWPQKVELNRRYVVHWSLRRDVRYLLRTLVPTRVPRRPLEAHSCSALSSAEARRGRHPKTLDVPHTRAATRARSDSWRLH